eukprot:12424415-Alexandrium_andersonii.AAC.1
MRWQNGPAPLPQSQRAIEAGRAAAWPSEDAPLEGLQAEVHFPPPIEYLPPPQDVFFDMIAMEAGEDGWAPPEGVSRRLVTAGFTPVTIK